MTRMNRFERAFNMLAATALAVYLMGFLHQTAGQYLV